MGGARRFSSVFSATTCQPDDLRIVIAGRSDLLASEKGEQNRHDFERGIVVAGLQIFVFLFQLAVRVDASDQQPPQHLIAHASDSLVKVQLQLHNLIFDELHDEVRVPRLTLTDRRINVDLRDGTLSQAI